RFEHIYVVSEGSPIEEVKDLVEVKPSLPTRHLQISWPYKGRNVGEISTEIDQEHDRFTMVLPLESKPIRPEEIEISLGGFEVDVWCFVGEVDESWYAYVSQEETLLE